MSARNKELLISGILLLFGFVFLPICIYIVGQNIIGEYSPDAGVFGLVSTIWGDLARFNVSAWLLALSPWAVIQLIRLSVRVWRRPAGRRSSVET